MQVFINQAAYDKLLNMSILPGECGYFQVKNVYVAWKVDDDGNFDTIETENYNEVFPFFKQTNTTHEQTS